jgi:hypothetical protein
LLTWVVGILSVPSGRSLPLSLTEYRVNIHNKNNMLNLGFYHG